MQGYESFDREFLDTADLWHLVPVGSVYRFLAENRRRLFPDKMFSDLFGPRGRPSIPGPVIGAVMVLQALECLSDREAIQRLRRDIAWKAATGLSLTHGGFHPTVLTLWRARLRASEKPERIFDAVRQVVTESGVLATRDRRALDSTILHDAVATQDTVTMISALIRMRSLVQIQVGPPVSNRFIPVLTVLNPQGNKYFSPEPSPYPRCRPVARLPALFLVVSA